MLVRTARFPAWVTISFMDWVVILILGLAEAIRYIMSPTLTAAMPVASLTAMAIFVKAGSWDLDTPAADG